MKLFRIVCLLGLLTACSPITPSGEITAEGDYPEAATSEVMVENFKLTSATFANGETIADKYTFSLGTQCSGENFSPPLEWSGAPSGTQSFAITVLDPDGGNWVHWVQFNIPADATGLPEAVGGPDVGVKGRNSFGDIGYGGPCPPSGSHRYIFTLYALNTVLSLPEGASHAEFQSAVQGYILDETSLTGLRSP